MSLDVSLIVNEPIQKKQSSGIFIRENGATKEISIEEWHERFPDREPIVLKNKESETRAYTANITHNLGKMARAAGLYEALWHPEELQFIETAGDLIPFLEQGLCTLIKEKDEMLKLNPDNGWGTYEGLLEFVMSYLHACHKYPEARVETSV